LSDSQEFILLGEFGDMPTGTAFLYQSRD
jgi:hypothetical protein